MTTPVFEDLEGRLKKLYAEVPAPPGELAAGREKMLAEAAQRKARVVPVALSATETVQTRKPERRRRMTTLLAYKLLPALLAAAIVITGTGGGVVFAAESLPGDVLHPVKLFVEDVRYLLAMSPPSRAELAMTFATERVQEMEQLVARNQAVPDHTVARMTRQMEQVMNQIALSQPEDVPALMQRLMERTRTQLQLLEQLQTMAQERTQTQLRLAAQVMERARQAAGAGLSDPQQFRNEYQFRYEGALSPQGEGSPGTEPEPSRNENQNRNEEMTGPDDQPSPSPVQQQQQSTNQYQNRNEGAVGPQPVQEQQQSQCQCCNEGDPCPCCDQPACDCTQCPGCPNEDPGSPCDPCAEPNQGGPSGNGH